MSVGGERACGLLTILLLSLITCFGIFSGVTLV